MTENTARPGPASIGAPGRALTWLAVRGTRRGAVIVALVAAGMSAMVAAQYQATIADTLDVDSMRALAENPAVRVLFGRARALDDPGGFTVWRTGTPILVLCGVWALLAATRITRGEEEAGRWDLLLGARLRITDLIARCAAILALAAALSAIGVGAALAATGTDVTGAAVYAGCVFGVTAACASLGLFTAQLLPSRAAAAGAAAAVVGIWLLLRMLSDGVAMLAWTAWLTPFGLTTRAAPYVENRTAPVLVLVGAAVALTTAALVLARRRDAGSAPIALADTRPPRTGLLGSVSAFAVRRATAPTAGWAVGIAAYFLLIGAVLATVIEFLDENRSFADLAADAGFSGLNTPEGFAAAIFALAAIPVGLYAAIRLAAVAADERARRYSMLHALPLSRYRLAGVEVAVTAGGIGFLLLTAAVSMWIGATLTGARLGLLDALAGAFNTAPIALLCLGAATTALGWFPGAVGLVGAVPVVGGFLLDILAESIDVPGWLGALSPFAHLAAVPASSPEPIATVVLTAIAIVLIALGLYGYGRRDLRD